MGKILSALRSNLLLASLFVLGAGVGCDARDNLRNSVLGSGHTRGKNSEGSTPATVLENQFTRTPEKRGSRLNGTRASELTRDLATELNSVRILGLGHTKEVNLLRASSNRLLSRDSSGLWILWDESQQEISRGLSYPLYSDPLARGWSFLDLRGSVLAFAKDDGNAIEIASSTDGQRLATVSTGGTFSSAGLASDGSYLWITKTSSLEAYSPQGARLFQKSGNYANAKIFASPDKLLIASGPGGTNAIESIDLASGSSSMSGAFNGTFHSWFLDGARFISTVGSVIYVYAPDATRIGLIEPSTRDALIAGSGAYMWTHESRAYPEYPLKIYRIDSGVTLVNTINTGTSASVAPSENLLAILPSGVNELTLVHLETNGVSTTQHSGSGAYLSAFAANAAGAWFTGNRSGTIKNDRDGFFGYGKVRSLAGSANGLFAVATAAGKILLYKIENDASTFVGALPYDSSALLLSRDGRVLAAQANKSDAQYHPDNSLTIFGLPAGNVIRRWNYSFPSDTPPGLLFDFDLSADGQIVSRNDGLWSDSTWSKNLLVDEAASGRNILTLTEDPFGLNVDKSLAPQLSPDGTGAALDKGHQQTSVYDRGLLSGAIDGKLSGWIDDNRLLINSFTAGRSRWDWVFSGAHIYDRAGTKISDSPLPQIDRFEVVSANEIFSAGTIYDLTSGGAVWSLGAAELSSSVGSKYVVFVKDGELRWTNWK
jgi:hypothetical protein